MKYSTRDTLLAIKFIVLEVLQVFTNPKVLFVFAFTPLIIIVAKGFCPENSFKNSKQISSCTV